MIKWFVSSEYRIVYSVRKFVKDERCMLYVVVLMISADLLLFYIGYNGLRVYMRLWSTIFEYLNIFWFKFLKHILTYLITCILYVFESSNYDTVNNIQRAKDISAEILSP